MVRVIEIDDISAASRDLLSIGSDKVGIEIMAPKAVSRVLKIEGVRPPAANIIKQEMLSFGGEAATTYGSINYSVDTTDMLVFGTQKQLQELIKKLKIHQFGLPDLAKEIEKALQNYDLAPKPIVFGNKTLNIGERTFIVGILNVTPDSFSDGGKFTDINKAVAHAVQMARDGADIIDIGGESTRPGAEMVSAAVEKERVVPVIEALASRTDAIISIDTTKSEVAAAALSAGASMVNDISGLLFDPEMAKTVKKFNVPVCVMHIQGNPRTMQENPSYSDLMGEIIEGLKKRIEIAGRAGILHEKIIVDPGIGFGKTVLHNLEILKRLRELKVLGCPIMVGTSRKSLIGQVLGLPADQRIEGTAATVAVSITNGVDIIRVHDVKEIVKVAAMADAIARASAP
ncbi:MAG: dihydropteroate synthase [Candidatus Margulisiibacteriota bacterium]|nr:dihydropteroate synthase [Candidatus Margulisiibacteriota bacterium]